jgi:hypothetical protein
MFVPYIFLLCLSLIGNVFNVWAIEPTIITAQHQKYTIYGNITKISYENKENLLGFNATQAFLGDGAHDLTVLTREEKNYKPDFCVNEQAVQPKEPNALRIMSFNVHNFHKICGSENIRKNPEFAVKTIEAIKPDIVALEEIVAYAQTPEEANAHTSQGVISVNFNLLDKLMEKLNFVYNIKVNDFQFHTNPNLQKLFMGKAIYTTQEIPITSTSYSSNLIGTAKTKDRGYLTYSNG